MTTSSLPKTLRQLVGAPTKQAIAVASSALLLIDFQNEYVDGALPLPEVHAAIANGRRLLDWASAAGIAVWHVGHHAARPNSPIFAPGSHGAAFVAGLQPAAGQQVVYKQLANSFAGTGLAGQLAEHGIQTLIVAGLMTHNCVSSTVRASLEYGLSPLLVGDACASRDLPDGSGGFLTAAEVHRASLTALGDSISEVTNTAALLALPLTA
jgi:nicotinamidase-related amidase